MFNFRKINNLWLFDFAADFFAIVAAYYTTLILRFHSVLGEKIFNKVNQLLNIHRSGSIGSNLEIFYITSAPRIIFFLTIILCLLYALRDLYPGRRFIIKRPVTWNILMANIIALVLFYTYFYLKRNIFHPRSFFATFICINVFYCVIFRGTLNSFISFIREKINIYQCPALLIGFNKETDSIYALIEKNHPHGIYIAGRISINPNLPFDNFINSLKDNMHQYNADMIICGEKELSLPQIMQILKLADNLDVSVKILSNKMDILINKAKLWPDIINGIPLVHFEAPSITKKFIFIRKLISALFTLIAMFIVIPVMCLIAVLIKLTSKGPVFFIQERIGVNRKPFQMYKFRTMYDRANELQAQIEEFNESGEGLFKIKKDPRITPVGRFLRMLSMDELPQFINIIKGEMTIIGPRPLPRRDFENYYEDWHYSRHSGMPGLTCLWQISGRSDITFYNMCILDVFYLKNHSWILDLKIFLKTIWVVLFAKGAY